MRYPAFAAALVIAAVCVMATSESLAAVTPAPQPGTTITGTVTDAATGLPLPVTVAVYVWETGPSGSDLAWISHTDPAGYYEVSQLQAGNYYVTACPFYESYVPQAYPSRSKPECKAPTSGTPITVSEGETTAHIDFALIKGGRIGGTVRFATSGLPAPAEGLRYYEESTGDVVNGGTDNDGRFLSFYSPPGRYRVAVVARASELLFNQIYPAIDYATTPPLSLGTAVEVSAERDTVGIDFSLNPSATIYATVKSAITGFGVRDARVVVYGSDGRYVQEALTDSLGLYVIEKLATGTYYLTAAPPAETPFLQQLFGGTDCISQCPAVTSGTPVALTAGTVRTDLDFSLHYAGTISGRVTAAATSTALAGVPVSIYSTAGTRLTGVTTDENGAYSLRVPPGTYYIKASGPYPTFSDALFRDIPCPEPCPVTIGTAVPVSAGSTRTVNIALPRAQLTGHVTAAGTGAPLAGATVTVYSASNTSVAAQTTDENGRYTLTNTLSAGNYYVVATGKTGYLGQVYNRITCSLTCAAATSGTSITVAANSTVVADFPLAAGGVVSGTVTSAAGGTPLRNVSVSIYASDGSLATSATTTASGTFATTTALPTGTYYAVVQPANGYLGQVYQSATCGLTCPAATTGTAIVVSAGATTSAVDFALVSGGTIVGRVHDAITSAPVAAALMYLFTASGTTVGATATADDGTYRFTGLPTGSYRAVTSLSSQFPYFNQVYSGITCNGTCPSATTGTAIDVVAGTATTGIDFPLVRAGVIEGRVTDGVGGAPLSGGSVSFYNASGSYVTGATSDASGHYATSGATLIDGTYFAKVSGTSTHFGQVYRGLNCGRSTTSCPSVLTGQAIAVVHGQVTSAIDFPLVRGGWVTGTVTAADSDQGAPVPNVHVEIYDVSYSTVATATVGADGQFRTTTPLDAGLYFAKAVASPYVAGYLSQIHAGIDCASSCPSPLNGTPIRVTNGAASRISFRLAANAAISGTVRTAATGAVLVGVSVQVFDASGRSLGSVTTNSSGQYSTSSLLTAGTYYLKASGASGYLAQIYRGVNCGTACPGVGIGQPVTVTTGRTTSGVDFSLEKGGGISGAVLRAADGTPLQGVTVGVYDANGSSVASLSTNSSGAYATTSPLPAGNYYVKAAWSSAGAELGQVYRGTDCGVFCPSVTSGTPVPVTLNSVTANIDFSLAPGRSIAGTVTSLATGGAIVAQYVALFDATGALVRSATTNASGVYSIVGLANGTYYLRTSGSSNTTSTATYYGQNYGGPPCISGCAPVMQSTPVVIVGNDRAGIDFALTASGRISGTVTAAGTGAGLSGYSVNIYSASGDLFSIVTTSASGGYVVATACRSVGACYAVVPPQGGYSGQLYSGVTCGATCPDPRTGSPIMVSPDTTTTGIDFALTTAGSISGSLTKRAGGGAVTATATVKAKTADGTEVSSTQTSTGSYVLKGIPTTGDYYVSVSATGYAPTLYDGVDCGVSGCPPLASATPVHVTSGAETSGINVTLATGGSISGSVTAGRNWRAGVWRERHRVLVVRPTHRRGVEWFEREVHARPGNRERAVLPPGRAILLVLDSRVLVSDLQGRDVQCGVPVRHDRHPRVCDGRPGDEQHRFRAGRGRFDLGDHDRYRPRNGRER